MPTGNNTVSHSLLTSSGGFINNDSALIYSPSLPSPRHSIMRMNEKANSRCSWVTPPYPWIPIILSGHCVLFPWGEKNYLFCWSELGAEQLGILQSLMVTCRLQGVNPYHYLVDVLQRVALHPARDVIDLTPRLWKQKYNQNRLVSDVKILTSQH